MRAYSAIDAQLLEELRAAIDNGTPMSVSLLRVLAARGWVRDPHEDDVILVRAAYEGDPDNTIEELSQELAVPVFTQLGERELVQHIRVFGD